MTDVFGLPGDDGLLDEPLEDAARRLRRWLRIRLTTARKIIKLERQLKVLREREQLSGASLKSRSMDRNPRAA